MSQFLLVCGILFIVTTTLIAIFMKEENKSQETGTSNNSEVNQEPDLGLIEAYQILWKILRNKNMPIVCLVFLTYSFPFSAAESSFKIQLVQMGISNDTIAQTSLPLIAVKIITVMLVTKFTTGPRPLNVFLAMYPCRLVMCLALAGLVSLGSQNVSCRYSLLLMRLI